MRSALAAEPPERRLPTARGARTRGSLRVGGFEYYAVLEAAELAERLIVPSGGAEAPHASRRLERCVDVASVARVRRPRVGARVASASWGDGPRRSGWSRDDTSAPIGASAFDVERGNVVVLDHAHRRLLQWRAEPPSRPRPTLGRGAPRGHVRRRRRLDLRSRVDAEPGRNPLVRRFDDAGRELDAVETAERTPSQIRMAAERPGRPQHPSNQWMPVAVEGAPASDRRAASTRRVRAARCGGGEVVVLRRGNEIRVALISGRRCRRSWRLSSTTALAEVQLAEPLGQRLVVVVRAVRRRRG